MKKNLLFLLISLAGSFGAESQTYNQGLHFIYLTTDSMEVYYKRNDDIVKQRSYKISNKVTSTKLSYSNNNFSSSVVINEFLNDTSINIYRWAIADRIKDKADSLKSIISSGVVEKYSELVDSMAFYISDIISPDTLKTELFQAVFYHNSILKSIMRYNNGADSCYCTSYVGYVAGLTSYHCNQDIIVDVEELEKALTDSIAALQRYGVDYLIDFLENYSQSKISYQELFNEVYDNSGGYRVSPIFAPFPCPWISGTDCGCCGMTYNAGCKIANRDGFVSVVANQLLAGKIKYFRNENQVSGFIIYNGSTAFNVCMG